MSRPPPDLPPILFIPKSRSWGAELEAYSGISEVRRIYHDMRVAVVVPSHGRPLLHPTRKVNVVINRWPQQLQVYVSAGVASELQRG